MTDIPDLPAGVVAVLDARAARLGLSRSEYVRRRLAQEAALATEPVTAEHLAGFAATFMDLGESQVMSGAWE